MVREIACWIKKVLLGRNINSKTMQKEAGLSQSGIRAFDRRMSQGSLSTYRVSEVVLHPGASGWKPSIPPPRDLLFEFARDNHRDREGIIETPTKNRDAEMCGNRSHAEGRRGYSSNPGRLRRVAWGGHMESGLRSREI